MLLILHHLNYRGSKMREKSIENNRRFFYKQESKTDELYRKAHLQYKAAVNPFIKVK